MLVRGHLSFMSICGLLLLAGPMVQAEVAFDQDSLIWRRARHMTVGQQVLSVDASYRRYSSSFSRDGEVAPLGDRYVRALTWREILESAPEARARIEQHMRDKGLGGTDVAAVVAYDADREDTRFAVNWAFGLTDRWAIGMVVPVSLRSARVRRDVQDNGALGIDQNMREKIAAAADQGLHAAGYDQVSGGGQAQWEWGDVSLRTRYLLTDTYRVSWALEQMTRVPTARNPSLSDFLRDSNDDGQVDIGLTSLVDFKFRRWVFGMRTGYVAQLPDSVRVRTSSDKYSVDPSVRRDLGDCIWGAVDADYRILNSLTLNLGYSFISKNADIYGGNSPDGFSYASFGQESDMELHQTRIGLALRLGGAGKRSGIENKWMVAAGYAYPWAGRNSLDASQATVELINYF